MARKEFEKRGQQFMEKIQKEFMRRGKEEREKEGQKQNSFLNLIWFITLRCNFCFSFNLIENSIEKDLSVLNIVLGRTRGSQRDVVCSCGGRVKGVGAEGADCSPPPPPDPVTMGPGNSLRYPFTSR